MTLSMNSGVMMGGMAHARPKSAIFISSIPFSLFRGSSAYFDNLGFRVVVIKASDQNWVC